MVGRLSCVFMRVLVASVAISALAFTLIAQDDPDPNSPTPILLSENSSLGLRAFESLLESGRRRKSRSKKRIERTPILSCCS